MTFPEIEVLASCQLVSFQDFLNSFNTPGESFEEEKNVISEHQVTDRGRGWGSVYRSHILLRNQLINVQTEDLFRKMKR